MAKVIIEIPDEKILELLRGEKKTEGSLGSLFGGDQPPAPEHTEPEEKAQERTIYYDCPSCSSRIFLDDGYSDMVNKKMNLPCPKCKERATVTLRRKS